MPLNDGTDTTDPVIERSLAKGGLGRATEKPDNTPSYKVMGDSKIPVSKALGKLWESRKSQGLAARKNVEGTWDEAIRYYGNDQSIHRDNDGSSAGNRPTSRLGNDWTSTENVVFANCSIMVPMLYAKNPTIAATASNASDADIAKALQTLGNLLIAKKEAPGLNLKPKARRAILTALLTNSAIVKIGWTKKDDASEVAITQLQDLAKELENAKNKKEILAVEGKIKALEEKVSLLQPSGPFVRNVMPHRIVRDPTSSEPDFSDANWLMEWDYLPTSYINAVYATMDGDQARSTFEPTHVLNNTSTSEGLDDIVNNFSLLNNKESDAASYGFDNVGAYTAAQYTKVWYVWDKTTRRVLMFADNKWNWPIWVWDDPLKLPRFFPYFNLSFHESVNSNSPKGEVTYYLDQQDTINEINSEISRGRQWAKRNIVYNKNLIKQEDVEAVLRGDDGTARGIDVPEGTKIEDAIFSIVPPGLKMPEFFSADSSFAAINRITGINDAQRGAQFKTNTTNQAIDTYNANTDIRVDERTDLIEDFIGDIMRNVLYLAQMNWTSDDVASLIDPENANAWLQITDSRDYERSLIRVEGGSTDKPNSKAKKQQAVQLGQILGQFANAAPAAIIVMLRLFERSFDEFVITDDDWKMIEQTMMMAMQKAGGGPGSGQPDQQQTGGDGQVRTAEELKAQTQERIAKLPPEAQQKLQQLVQGGMPPAEALQKIEADLAQATPQGGGQ